MSRCRTITLPPRRIKPRSNPRSPCTQPRLLLRRSPSTSSNTDRPWPVFPSPCPVSLLWPSHRPSRTRQRWPIRCCRRLRCRPRARTPYRPTFTSRPSTRLTRSRTHQRLLRRLPVRPRCIEGFFRHTLCGLWDCRRKFAGRNFLYRMSSFILLRNMVHPQFIQNSQNILLI